jgi:glycosyltransferase involved in cell wall biosynthesis
MIAQSIEILNEEYRVYLIYFERTSTTKKQAPPIMLEGLEALSLSSVPSLIRNIVKRRKRSLQEALFYSKCAQERIEDLILSLNPTLVIADMLRTAQYFEDIEIPKICELDDLLSVRYQRALEVTDLGGDLLGTFGNAMPKGLRKIINGPLRKWLLEFEMRRVYSREVEIARRFSGVTLVSQLEKDTLINRVPGASVTAVPPGIREFREAAINITKNTNDHCKLLFLGNLKTYQNILSLKWVVDNIFPILEKRGLEFSYVVAGEYDERAKLIAENHPRIVLLGFVHDLDNVINNSVLLLSPIRLGTGIKLKILDALAHGLPVITNSIGAEGIAGTPGVDFIIKDNPDEIAEAVIRVCADLELREAMSKAGNRLIMQYYLLSDIKKRYLQFIREAIVPRNR